MEVLLRNLSTTYMEYISGDEPSRLYLVTTVEETSLKSLATEKLYYFVRCLEAKDSFSSLKDLSPELH